MEGECQEWQQQAAVRFVEQPAVGFERTDDLGSEHAAGHRALRPDRSRHRNPAPVRPRIGVVPARSARPRGLLFRRDSVHARETARLAAARTAVAATAARARAAHEAAVRTAGTLTARTAAALA